MMQITVLEPVKKLVILTRSKTVISSFSSILQRNSKIPFFPEGYV